MLVLEMTYDMAEEIWEGREFVKEITSIYKGKGYYVIKGIDADNAEFIYYATNFKLWY